MSDEYILKARELLAAEYERQGIPGAASYYRTGRYDDDPETIVLARVLRKHAEKQPTFEQELEAMQRAWWAGNHHPKAILEAYKAALAEIMAPPVDPLVEAVNEAFPHVNVEYLTEKLRKALAARGLEIREVQA